LAIAALVFVLSRLFGFSATYDATFKWLATIASVLPIWLLAALVIFLVEFGFALIVFGVLGYAGLAQEIPRRYEIVGLYLMAALALVIAGFNAIRYAVLIGR